MLTVDLFSSKLLAGRIQPLFLVALSPASPTHGYSTMFPDQACSQGGSVGSEEPPSQRKVHYLVMKAPPFKKRSTVITTPYRDVGIGLADLAATRLKFCPQLKLVLIN